MIKRTEFFRYEEIFEQIQALFIGEKKNIQNLFPNVDIQHVGSSSVPNSLTKKDLDIQIRVSSEDFKKVVNVLSGIYKKHHEELWNNQFAIMNDLRDGIHIDFMITVKDSKYDDFYKLRDFLIQNPSFLEKYNTLKMKHSGKDYSKYSKAKNNFFGGNGEIKFLNDPSNF